MRQPAPAIHRRQELERLLWQKEKETREIKDELLRAQSSASTTTAAALEPITGGYHVSPSRPPLQGHERLRDGAVPRTADSESGPGMQGSQQQVRLLHTFGQYDHGPAHTHILASRSPHEAVQNSPHCRDGICAADDAVPLQCFYRPGPSICPEPPQHIQHRRCPANSYPIDQPLVRWSCGHVELLCRPWSVSAAHGRTYPR